MILSPIFTQISKKANYYRVNKSYFIASLLFSAFLMIFSKNLGLAVGLFIILIACGTYLTKKDPDFFDILIESKRFKLFNKIYKTNNKRVWQA